MRLGKTIMVIAAFIAVFLTPSVATATGYSLATAVGKTSLEVIPGTSTYGAIYFYNVDGTQNTYIAMETLEFPDGWTVEYLPALSTITVSVSGVDVDVDQNLYIEPTPVWTEETPAPAGQVPLALPNRFGPDTTGYTWAKELKIKITVPASAPIGEQGDVEVNAVASYLGQTGAAIIGQERPFTFTVNVVSELTEETIRTPFDWNRWLPVILAGGIGVAVLGVIYVPKLIAKRRKSA
jgi:hypothetical protein